MKRAGNLIELITDADNLRLAFLKASKGKRTNVEVLKIRDNLDAELVGLRKELQSGDVHWGEYHRFLVSDPKPRTICAAPFRARVGHHAIINICEPVFETYQIFDSYACRKGKGLDGALGRALKFSRHGDWFLQMDIRKYFDSIDHRKLYVFLEKRFKDQTVLDLFESLLATYESSPGKGVPIGNLTSQFFANHYLAFLDHFIKESLGCKRYVRYMDDFVIWATSKLELLTIRKMLIDFLDVQLSLELKPVCLNTCDRGMSFLGYRIFPQHIRLARRSRARFQRKFAKYTRIYRAGDWDEAELARHIEPLLAFVRRGASRSYRERIIKEFGLFPEARTE